MSLKKEIQDILHPHGGTPKMSDEREVELPTIESLDDTSLDALIDLDSMPGEYWKYCNTNDAKRAWRRAVFFKVSRVSTLEMKKEVEEKINYIKIIDKSKRGTHADFEVCMNELEEVLKARRESLK